MKKVYLSWFKISSLMHNIIRGLHNDAWRPDYVIGIVRGGNYPAGLYSHFFFTFDGAEGKGRERVRGWRYPAKKKKI